MSRDREVSASTAKTLLSVAAHELRHPLHVMRMALARDLADSDPTRINLERYIDRMNRLIQDLVDYVRTEDDALELHREEFDLHRVFVDLLDDYRSTFGKRRIRLSVMAPTDLTVHADRQRLLQVLANLLDNALKFTPRGGEVSLEARRREREVAIVIRDTGIGLSAAGASAREIPTALSGAQGFGIGLAVARRILELHGGTLTMRDARPEYGTEVVLTLPVVPASRPS